MKSNTTSVGPILAIEDDQRLLVGIDVGGTKTHVAVADAGGAVLVDHLLANDARRGAALVDDVVTSIADLLPTGALVGAFGIGVAGAVDGRAGTIDLAPNLDGLDIASFTVALQDRWHAPVAVDNDVNAAALGERAFGHAVGVDDFVFVAVGTGIGMGVVSGGRLLRGTRQAAGEIGYLPIGADPYDPAHHVHGPLEEVVSGPAIAASYRRRAGEAITSHEVFARLGVDPTADGVLDTVTEHLALALVSVRAVLDPELVVLGGGVGSRPEVRERLTPWLDRLGAADLSVRTSQLGAAATVRGAVELARMASPDAALHRTHPTPSHRDGTP